MDPVKSDFDRSLSQKLSRRSRLAALPFEEKVRMVVELQKMQEPILRARGKNIKVWSLDKVNLVNLGPAPAAAPKVDFSVPLPKRNATGLQRSPGSTG
jgi:hypothetical protein